MKKYLLKIIATFIIFFYLSDIGFSQDMLGIINSNYAGTNSIHINPAYMANSKLCMDINVVTVNPTLQNNYLYFDKDNYNISALYKKSCFVNSMRYIHNEYENNKDDAFIINDNYNKKDKYLYNSCLMQLPSLMLTYNRHAFAFNMDLRTAFSIRNMSYNTAKFGFDGTHFKPQQGIYYDHQGSEITQLAWSEINLSYAYLFKQNPYSQWSFGISTKYLLGYSSVFVEGYDEKYMVIDDETMQIYNLDAEYGHCMPDNPLNGSYENLNKTFKGNGLGMTIGISYQKNTNISNDMTRSGLGCNNHENYLYKIGLSLIDFGYINFKHGARTFKLDNVSTLWEDFDKVNITDIENFDKTISSQFYGDPEASRDGDKYKIVLPAALSLQFDYQFRPNYYLNTTIIQNVKVGEYQVHRPSVVAITPRYESPWFELAVPISLQNYQRTSMGLAVRLWGFTFGTDRLGGFLGFNDVYGLDFYCSIKLSFVNGTCKKQPQNSKMELANFKKKAKNRRSSRKSILAFSK